MKKKTIYGVAVRGINKSRVKLIERRSGHHLQHKEDVLLGSEGRESFLGSSTRV